jgi:translation initiation factor IF-2
MASIRVHEVAKRLGLSSKEAVDKFNALGILVKGHSSTVSESDVTRLVKALNGGAARQAAAKAAAAPPVPVTPPAAQQPAPPPAVAQAAPPSQVARPVHPEPKTVVQPVHPEPKTVVRPVHPEPKTVVQPVHPEPKTVVRPVHPEPKVHATPQEAIAPSPPASPPTELRPQGGRDASRQRTQQDPANRQSRSQGQGGRSQGQRPSRSGGRNGGRQGTPTREAARQEPAAPEPPSPPVGEEAPAAAAGGPVHVPHGVTVEELAEKMDRSPGDIIKTLLVLGEMKTITQSLSDSLVEIVADELGVPVQIVSVEEEAKEHEDDDEAPEDPSMLTPRAPIVTVMGHVDHGKSSILQQFRKKEMLSLEAGGITQAIGAYQVHTADGRTVTFIDTPGHEAFTQMRARGAQVTDVAILVVAADDGVQPQTIEAMDHAKAAGVPIIVAVNKIDKPEADPIRARQQLAEHGLSPEEWGGETVFVDVSAKQGTNLDDLLEMVHLVTDMQELKANTNASARGVSIEAHLDKGRGPVATLIVQKGTLRVGDPVVCGAAWCKVRALTDEAGKNIREAGPSQPVLVTGWSQVPQAGDEFRVVADDREAKRIAQERESKLRQAEFAEGGKAMSLEDLLSKARTGDIPELKLIVKANSQGAIEALSESIDKLDQSLVRTVVQRKAVGAINENDIWMAKASGAIVVGFAVRPDAGARQLAEKEGVDVRLYEVIYQLLDDITKATHGLLAPLEEEVVLGSAEVRETFRTPKAVVAGSYVTEGKVVRNAKARLLRDGNVIHTGEISSLRRFKDDVREVTFGYECGITIANYNDIKIGDIIETYEIREVART